jgi:hypothetical protein
VELAGARVWLERGAPRVSAHRFLTLPSRRVRPAAVSAGVDVLGLLTRQAVEPGAWSFGEPLFVRAPVGRGSFFYLGADVEAGLLLQYDPWAGDETHLLYEALLPAADVDIDNPAVELAHKARGGEELLLLANHSESWQDVTLSAQRPLRLEDLETGGTLGEGTQVSLRLSPAQVVFARAHPASPVR